MNYLGFAKSKYPSVSPEYAFIQSIKGKTSRTVQLYRLTDGTIETVKVRKKQFDANPFEENQIIKTIDCFDDKKWKYDSQNDSYYQIDEKERILSKWSIVEDD